MGTPSPVRNGTRNDKQPQHDETLSDLRESHKDDHVQEAQEPVTTTTATATADKEEPARWWFFSNSTPLPVEVVALERDNTKKQPTSAEVNGMLELSEQLNGIPPVLRRQSWAEWATSTTRVNSVVSYLHRPQDIKPIQQNGDHLDDSSQLIEDGLPLEENIGQNISLATTDTEPPVINTTNQASLISWLNPWSYFPAKENDAVSGAESIYSSKDSEEIAKDARKAIQNNNPEDKNPSWAFHSSETGSNGELLVIGTGSATHPANMASPPITYGEAQERSLKPTLLQEELKMNQVVPKFDDCYRKLTPVSKARIVLSSSKLLKQTFNIKPQTHLYRSEVPKNIKKAVVIGIHGFFPIKMVRTLIGHPTGTSMKFATKATEVLSKWSKENNIEMNIETIALEGEGKIIERVESLLNLLENWMNLLNNCDFIYVASHSQGVMVAIHLIAELILRNKISTRHTKIGLLNMCGVCNGPIVGLDSKLIVKLYSKFENEILMELFDFQDLTSPLSTRLLKSMQTLVSNNVKLTFIGSANDQLSPLYSSLYTIVNHPNIARGLFVDGNSSEEIPKFLVKLLEDCMIAQNMGYSDCDLVFELSKYSGGSLTNGGHSKVYNEDEVYLLGIRNTLERSDLVLDKPPTLKISNRQFNAKNISETPYHLPWCLRGFLDELVAIKNLNGTQLMAELLQIYNDWTPQTKNSKDLKYCVEVISQTY